MDENHVDLKKVSRERGGSGSGRGSGGCGIADGGGDGCGCGGCRIDRVVVVFGGGFG